MKRILALALCAALLLTLCACGPKQRFQTTYLDLFDTVTTITGYAENQAVFQKNAQKIHDLLLEYHQLFDIYHTYAGMNNLCTLNTQAGGDALPMDERVLDLLAFSQEICTATDGAVNIAMGGVLRLWHEARTAAADDPDHAALPDEAALQAAAEHRDIAALVLDRSAGTVRITDPAVQLDVGAIAKGYAAEAVAQAMLAEGLSGYLLNVGGNVRTIGPNRNGTDWTIGLQQPDGSDGFLARIGIQDGAVVTSGSYQRYFTANGKEYHHIIDPNTLYPGENCTSVTIYAPDSGLADALSTALFLLPYEDGLALLETYGAEAFWVFPDGTQAQTPGFAARLLKGAP